MAHGIAIGSRFSFSYQAPRDHAAFVPPAGSNVRQPAVDSQVVSALLWWRGVVERVVSWPTAPMVCLWPKQELGHWQLEGLNRFARSVSALPPLLSPLACLAFPRLQKAIASRGSSR